MKKILSFCITLCVVLSLCMGALAAQPIIDRADLFSADEESVILSTIEHFRTLTGMDFVVVTSNENTGTSQQNVADELYDRGGFGLGENKSGILYYIDMYERIPYLSTAGDMIDYMTDERIEAAHESSYDELGEGDYAGAVLEMLKSVAYYVGLGIPEGQYQYDIITGQKLTAAHKALTSTEMLVCALVAVVAALLFIMNVQGRYKLKGSTYEYSMRDNVQMNLTAKEDQYLHSTTTRTRKPKDPPPSQRSSGGSHPGRSSVHHSSGGVRHGGGAGKRF